MSYDKSYRITEPMKKYRKNPRDALDIICAELFVQEYKRVPTTGDIFWLDKSNRELYETAVWIFNLKLRLIYEMQGTEVPF